MMTSSPSQSGNSRARNSYNKIIMELSGTGGKCQSLPEGEYEACATSRKVAGSIPDGVSKIFQWLNPSGRIVALG
jgi:hypothetical protein